MRLPEGRPPYGSTFHRGGSGGPPTQKWILSLCYIPLGKIAYSLLTVILSGQLIGIVERFDFRLMKREGLRLALANAAKGK